MNNSLTGNSSESASNFELWAALFSVIAVGSFFVAYALLIRPAPGDGIAHWLGITGTLLMLYSEVGYMARKRVSWLQIGPLSAWLSAHIFTGIVGPAMVLMHTTLKFRGLAGLTTLLTLLVVTSGFVGRYLYTAIPLSMAGAEQNRYALRALVVRAQAALSTLAATRSETVQRLVEQTRPAPSAGLMHSVDERQYRRRIRKVESSFDRAEHAIASKVADLQGQVRQAERQLATLDAARRVISLWHLIHVPLGLSLIVMVAIHVFAAYYFGAVGIR